MIYVGTCGFSYDDWVGPFYPAGMKKTAMLPWYAKRFRCVEVNATHYTPPSVRMSESFVARTPADFQFSIKAHKQMTHEPGEGSIFSAFAEGLRPLLEAGKLGTLLLQFPFSFYPTSQNIAYLESLAEKLAWAPLTVEFRNVAWLREETFDLLRRLNMAYCCVDEPKLKGLIPPLVRATTNLGYLRFHGRNAAKWWQHEQPYERYDYLYSQEELSEWVEKIRELAAQTEKVFAFFNNHYQGKAAVNAAQLIEMLEPNAEQ